MSIDAIAQGKEIRRINRKLKAAMTQFIKNDSETALRSIGKLVESRDNLLSQVGLF